MKVGLIGCSKKKQDYVCKASEMYQPSNLFKKAWNYCQRTYNKTVILSAKYGLLDPEREIEPYDVTLSGMSKQERMAWSHEVLQDIDDSFPQDTVFYIHAGAKYREWLESGLENCFYECHVPLRGLGMGQQLKWYSKKLEENR